MTIAEVAARTRIQALYFEAIEKDDTSSLPGGFFYRSFVRQYARLLELPAEQYERELERHLTDEQTTIAAQPSSLPERPLSVPPMPTGMANPAEETRRWLLRLGGLAIVILLCSLIYSLSMNWKAWFGEALPASAPIPPVAQAPIREKQPEPASQPATQPAATPEAGSPAEPQAATPAGTPAGTVAAPPPAEAPKPAEAQPQSTGAVSVSIKATEQVWVQVRDGGKVVFSNIIPLGETRTFSSNGKLRVLFGNAGGVELMYNGKPMPAPGPKGQVRTVEFSTTGADVIVKPAASTPTPPAGG